MKNPFEPGGSQTRPRGLVSTVALTLPAQIPPFVGNRSRR